MSIPLLVVDDSSFARKQVIRALPDDWDIEVFQASNGEEAIAEIEAGHGDIVLLDLTMPIMDGFAVLEAIKQKDLNAIVIVVSGDIQPESRARVMELGALAFIKKPVQANALIDTLADFGVFSVNGGQGDDRNP